jgi:hypothetical protein
MKNLTRFITKEPIPTIVLSVSLIILVAIFYKDMEKWHTENSMNSTYKIVCKTHLEQSKSLVPENKYNGNEFKENSILSYIATQPVEASSKLLQNGYISNRDYLSVCRQIESYKKKVEDESRKERAKEISDEISKIKSRNTHEFK